MIPTLDNDATKSFTATSLTGSFCIALLDPTIKKDAVKLIDKITSLFLIRVAMR